MRIILAAVLGGLVMFFWGAFSHMALGLGSSSIKQIPNEAAVVEQMRSNIVEPGIYFVPGADMSRTMTEVEMSEYAARHKEGPTATIVYHPTGTDMISLPRLGNELASNILAALVAAIILAFAAVGFGRAWMISTLIGVTGWLSISASYWNWYRFPTRFVIDELLDQVVGWLLSGFVLAFIMRRRD